jgi:hypothetical protein
MIHLSVNDKVIIEQPMQRTNGRVIGSRLAGSVTVYYIEPLRVDFRRYKSGSRIMRVLSTEIEQNQINIKKH